MLDKLIFPLCALLIVSCSSSQINFIPSGDTLRAAKVGIAYEQDIAIGTDLESAPEFLTEENTKVNIYPSDTGLHIAAKNKRKDGLSIYNFISVSGVPLKTGIVNISISGFTYGSMYTKGSQFNKVYSLEIK